MRACAFYAFLFCFLPNGFRSLDPPRLPSTCSFKFHILVNERSGLEPSATFDGFTAVLYSEDEDGRKEVTNRTQRSNGVVRHQYMLERQDIGREYYMNWTENQPRHCYYDHYPTVIDIWHNLDFEEFKYNGTRNVNGTRLEIWQMDIGGGEYAELGVRPDARDVPVMYAEVTEGERNTFRTVMYISEFSINPDASVFEVPWICNNTGAEIAHAFGRKRKVSLMLRKALRGI